MTEKEQDRKFINNAKSVFDESVGAIEGSTLSRLTQIRHAALQGMLKGSEPFFIKSIKRALTPLTRKWIFVPAAAVATVLLVYGLVFNAPDKQVISADDIELISSSDSLEFYEDLEFYEWLEEYEIST